MRVFMFSDQIVVCCCIQCVATILYYFGALGGRKYTNCRTFQNIIEWVLEIHRARLRDPTCYIHNWSGVM